MSLPVCIVSIRGSWMPKGGILLFSLPIRSRTPRPKYGGRVFVFHSPQVPFPQSQSELSFAAGISGIESLLPSETCTQVTTTGTWQSVLVPSSRYYLIRSTRYGAHRRSTEYRAPGARYLVVPHGGWILCSEDGIDVFPRGNASIDASICPWPDGRRAVLEHELLKKEGACHGPKRTPFPYSTSTE